jgi:hypothetical protein
MITPDIEVDTFEKAARHISKLRARSQTGEVDAEATEHDP